MAAIYALICPLTDKIRYIGRTLRANSEERFKEHLWRSNKTYSSNPKLSEWIDFLINIGTRPRFLILIEGDFSNRDIDDLEQIYIDRYALTNELFNLSKMTKLHDVINVEELRQIAKMKKIRYRVLANHIGVSYASIASYLCGCRNQLSMKNASRLKAIILSF